MGNINSFLDLKFHELDVLLLLREINPSKAAGPDGINEMILKYVLQYWLNRLLSCIRFWYYS